jgi:hypothetical protein
LNFDSSRLTRLADVLESNSKRRAAATLGADKFTRSLDEVEGSKDLPLGVAVSFG